jgi:hypothetical protein
MTEKRNDGGWAFAHNALMPDGSFYTSRGMTLRDYFAAQALIAISGLWKGGIGDFDNEAADRTAKASYRMADAMLKERDR